MILNVDEYHYYADEIGAGLPPSLNVTTATTIVTRSALHAWLEHPRFGGKRREVTKEMDRGSLLHALVLGKGKQIIPVKADDWRTKVARELREEIRESGQIPVLEWALDEAREASTRITENLNALGYVLDGKSEVPMSWSATADDGTAVLCRGMFDHIKDNTVFDLKVSDMIQPSGLASKAIRMGYDIQAAAYLQGYETTNFVFLFVEPTEPWSVVPAIPTDAFMQLGQFRWKKAINIWSQCLKTNIWPSYTDAPVPLDPPMWALRENEIVLYPNAIESTTYCAEDWEDSDAIF